VSYNGLHPKQQGWKNMAAYYESPIGWFKIEETLGKLSWVGMVEQAVLSEESALELECKAQMQAYFSGALRIFDLPYDLGELSPFSKSIFEILLRDVVYGKRISYGDLAKAAHAAGAQRAVGRAMASNPITIVVPCHRVVAAKGIGGYAWSGRKKEWLLDFELAHLRG
jgi:methylated-DNA-[protein]-cysteine S-methyltransferase